MALPTGGCRAIKREKRREHLGDALEEKKEKLLAHRVLALWQACAEQVAPTTSSICPIVMSRIYVFANEPPEAPKVGLPLRA